LETEFYGRLYETEWARRDQIQSAASTPIAVLALLGGALNVLVQHFDRASAALAWCFWPLFGMAVIGFIVTGYRLVRTFLCPAYERIPLPSLLHDYRTKLLEHYRALGTPLFAVEEFESVLRDHYIRATDRNAVNNINRGEYLYKANRSLVFTLAFTALAATPVAIHVKTAPDEPQKVRIVNFDQRREPVSREPRPAGMHVQTAPPPPSRSTQVHVPPKPVPPENIQVRTGVKLPPRP
jgi:hypothetical protein